MRRIQGIFIGIGLILLISGCIQMRDYTGVKDGAAGLDVQNRFGEGMEKKDYYVVDDGDGIVVGDNKNEVLAHLGLPDEVKTTVEGYEYWIYQERQLKLFFSGDRFIEWEEF